jgi:pimeloyl-ACP methyl ester carboxylesterase
MKIALRVLVFLVLFVLVAGGTFYINPIGVADQGIRFKLWQQGVHSEYIDVGGYRIHYLEAPASHGAGANGEGPPLLLIHGLGSRAEDWANLIPQLAASGFHVYAPDLLGYGRSPQPDVDYSISLEEKLIVQFMEAVHLPKADVGGWSMGGWVAAKLTVDHPELVDRLVLYDSAGIYFPATFDASLFSPSDKAGLVHLTEMLEPDPPKLPDFAVRAAIRKLQRNAWVIQRSVSAMTSGRDLLDFRLAHISRPTLIVWGDKDILIPVSVAESMHQLIPRSSLVFVQGCGHLAPAQCSAPVIATTVKFLDSAPPWSGVEQTLPGH